MKFSLHHIATLALLVTSATLAGEDLPATLMTKRGKLLASEDFTQPLAPLTGKPVGFASGFSGWRYNAASPGGKSGRWELSDGFFKGMETPGANHPATASFGIRYTDAVIQCQVRMNDVPADGRKYRSISIKATDTKDYVISFSMGPGAGFLTPYDADQINPATKQRMTGKAPRILKANKLDEWHTLVLEIKGDEVVGTLDGKSATVSNPLIAAEKHSVMLVASTEASFRNFRIWEALPNPDWSKNKAILVKEAQEVDAKTKEKELEKEKKKSETATLDDTFHPEKLAEVDAMIEQAIRDSKLLGAAVWIERNRVAYHKAFGQRTTKPAAEVMTEDTLIDLASVTKVLAGTSAAMLCVERGLMKLDDLVSSHLPEFTGDGREKITIRHLLLHSSGLPVNLNSTLPPFSSPADAIAQACHTKLLFAPGTAYSYSSAGTMVLGGVIEHITKRKFDEFCTTEVFQPLGMSDTVFRPDGEQLRRVAPTDFPERGKVNDTVARLVGGVASHASLFSTTADIARFARMMLNLGGLDGVRIFQTETVKLFTTVQSPPDLKSFAAKDLPVRRGLGWDIDTPYRTPPHHYSLARGALFPIGSYGHTGWTGQMLWIDPFSRTFVIFLCNRYVDGVADTRPAVYQLHHDLSTLVAEAVKSFDFKNVPGALSDHAAPQAKTREPFTNSLGMTFVPVPGTQALMCIHETRRAERGDPPESLESFPPRPHAVPRPDEIPISLRRDASRH